MNKTTAAKKRARWERHYGSEERVLWMKQLNCHVCGRIPSDCAHVKAGGMGMKADAKWTIPLCRTHHMEMDNGGKVTFSEKYGVDLEEAARSYEARWQAVQGGELDCGF